MWFRYCAPMVMLLAVTLVRADPLPAGTDAEAKTIELIQDGMSQHEAILKKIEEERARQKSLQDQLKNLSDELAAGKISLEQAQGEAQRLRDAAVAQKSLIEDQEEKMDRLVNLYELSRRQNEAKWVFPILVGLYAANRYADNSVGDQLLWGFAGFGAMMAWEQTGYGPGRVIGSGINYMITKSWKW